ncbi:hypothetical protein G6011_00070 [Alternaria panax]|uniref:Mid2 domain-containing protein n=1 Tax=Alternaria panax TaxID=48097 RepID=A0AAD4NVE4_9PLEO|nr:hypothetical protein G6011_00070 [Alternaria panax]
MSRLAGCALFTGLLARVSGASLDFINPPPYNATDSVSNYPKYKKGDIVKVSWTPGEISANISLLLVQQDVYDLMYPEWLLENIMGFTGFDWLVETRKNLADSNLFSFSVYQGSTELATSSKNSQYFFIEEDSNEVSESSSWSLSPATSPTPTLDGASTPATTATSSLASESTPESTLTSSSTLYTTTSSTRTSIPTGSNIPDQQIIQDGFSLGAKIGLGVGIPIAVVLGLLVGCLLFRRRKRDSVAYEMPAGAAGHLKSNENGYERSEDLHEASGPDLHEAARASIYEAPPNQLPVEIGQSQKEVLVKWGDGTDNDPETPASARYEMDASTAVELRNEAVEQDEKLAKNDA